MFISHLILQGMFFVPIAFTAIDPLYAELQEQEYGVPQSFQAHHMRYRLEFEGDPPESQFEVYVTKPASILLPLLDYGLGFPIGGEFPNLGVLDLAHGDSPDLMWNRVQTHSLLQKVWDTLVQDWKDRGLYKEDWGTTVYTKEFQTIRDGFWPTLILTRPAKVDENGIAYEPGEILWIASMALDYGEGLPFSWRVFGREYEQGNIPKRRPKKKQPWISQKSKVRNFGEWLAGREKLTLYEFGSRLQSLLPFVEGEEAEFKNYYKNKAFKKDARAVFFRLILRHELFRWGVTKVSPRLRAKQARMLKGIVEREPIKSLVQNLCEKATPELCEMIQWELDFPIHQPTVRVSKVFMEVNGDVREFHQWSALSRVYQRQYGLNPPKWWLAPDPEFGGKTEIFESERYSLESTTMDTLEALTAGDLKIPHAALEPIAPLGHKTNCIYVLTPSEMYGIRQMLHP